MDFIQKLSGAEVRKIQYALDLLKQMSLFPGITSNIYVMGYMS